MKPTDKITFKHNYRISDADIEDNFLELLENEKIKNEFEKYKVTFKEVIPILRQINEYPVTSKNKAAFKFAELAKTIPEITEKYYDFEKMTVEQVIPILTTKTIKIDFASKDKILKNLHESLNTISRTRYILTQIYSLLPEDKDMQGYHNRYAPFETYSSTRRIKRIIFLLSGYLYTKGIKKIPTSAKIIGELLWTVIPQDTNVVSNEYISTMFKREKNWAQFIEEYAEIQGFPIKTRDNLTQKLLIKYSLAIPPSVRMVSKRKKRIS
ncbi:hypothetical protein AAIR98_001369 [Elusimicrobium simillimum]|uniref:hypothetical protein n=1 Tax=Elusimicrobium simillimum TaxID=3143438 RepID=UPI003C705D39